MFRPASHDILIYTPKDDTSNFIFITGLVISENGFYTVDTMTNQSD